MNYFAQGLIFFIIKSDILTHLKHWQKKNSNIFFIQADIEQVPAESFFGDLRKKYAIIKEIIS
jgi:hypothetical protein